MSENRSRRVSQLARIQLEALELFARKNRDYGDSFASYGPVGVIVRLNQKIARMVSVSRRGATLMNDELLRGIMIDVMNYAAMCVMCHDDVNKENTPPATRVAPITPGARILR